MHSSGGALADRREFDLSAEDWERFVAELDRPARASSDRRLGLELRVRLIAP